MVLRKVRALGRRLACAGYTRLRVDDDRTREEAGLMERFEGEECRRRIATWVRDQPGTADLRLMALGESVNGPSGSAAVAGYHR